MIVIPIAPGINERLDTSPCAEDLTNERLMENQNCRKDSKQLCINADKKCQAARLICNKSCSLVLKRCIIIGSLIRVAAEPGCAQQPDKSEHANAAANRSKPTVFCKVAYDRKNCQQRLPHGWQESLSAKLRKRTYRAKPIKEKTVQKYRTVVSAALSDAKRNEIIEKNPARMIELPDVE